MNEVKQPNNNISSNIMISQYQRRKIRKTLRKTNKEIQAYKRNKEYKSVNEAYADLINQHLTDNPPLNEEEKNTIRKSKNREANRKYRERVRAKKSLTALNNGSISTFNINMGNMGLQADAEAVLKILIKSNSNLLLTIGGVGYTFNERAISIWQSYFNGMLFKNITDSSESDEELLNVIADFDTITVTKAPINTGNNTAGGAFFKFYHNLDCIDLERYGIYDDMEDPDDSLPVLARYMVNCFIHALQMGGIDETTISYAKTKIINSFLPAKDIKVICKECDLFVEVSQVFPSAKDKVIKYGRADATQKIKLGLVENHYFIIDDVTDITEWAIKNYNLLQEEEVREWWRRRSLKRNGRKAQSSLRIIKCLLENKDECLRLIPQEDLYHSQYYNNDYELETLEYTYYLGLSLNDFKDDSFIKEKTGLGGVYSVVDYRFYEPVTVFFDFETDTNYGDKKQHVPYLCRCKVSGESNVAFYGADCAEKMMRWLIRFNPRKKLVMVAHNCGYDFRFIKKLLKRQQLIECGNFLICGSGLMYSKLGTVPIEFKDSYRMISMRLADFGKAFNLPCQKDLMFYDLYSTSNIAKKYINLEECLSHAKNKEEEALFLSNCDKWNILHEGKVDIISYSSEYCKLDVDVLEAGYEQFRSNIKKISSTFTRYKKLNYEMDIYNYYTISGVAEDLLKSDDCFEETFSLANVPRAFIQKCVVGGRTMLCENKKQYIEQKTITDPTHRHFGKVTSIADFDGVSLYPSAMKRINGFIKGVPKVIKKLTKEFLKTVDAYYIKIHINSVGKKLKFPLMSYVDDEGNRLWSNDCEGKFLYVDKIALEEWIIHQDIDYDIIEGYYFDDGFNNQIVSTIERLFNERLKFKSAGNRIEMVYKLIMNSAYGRTLMKPFETSIKYVDKGKISDEFPLGKTMSNYVGKNYNVIKSFVLDESGDTYQVKAYESIDEHYNNVHQGVYILSMSKRIMNEVMVTAENEGLDMYYTDTDSIHMCDLDVPLLAEAYKTKYNKELVGKELGQFHNDFSLGSCSNVHSTLFIGLGKKCYVDVLKGDNNGEVKTDHHIRMKGVPTGSVKGRAKELNITLGELYEKMYNGNPETFNLCKDKDGYKKLCFKYNKDFSVTNRNDDKNGFSRTLKF